MVGFFASQSEVFLTVSNAINVLQAIAQLAILAAGVTIVMTTGRIDLSIGNSVSALGVLAAAVAVDTGSVPLAVLAAIGGGAVIGAANGITIAYLRLPDFIATLAMGFLVSGLDQGFTQGYPITNLPPGFGFFALTRWFGIPVSVYVMGAVIVVAWVILNMTVFGRHAAAIGGKEQAARWVGINIRRNVFLSYVICGVGAGITGVVTTSRIMSGQPLAGDNLLLPAIATVFLGATAFRHGEPNLMGTLLGALIIGTMGNGLTLMNVPYYFQAMATGVIIVAAVAIAAAESGTRT